MALQSQLFRGDSRLEAAAESDPDHIQRGASGPHVGKIQTALIQLDGAAITQDSKYGPATAAAVREFKQKRNIFNFQGKLDDIVGKKTMAALDEGMLAKEKDQGGGGKGGRLGFKIVDDTPAGPPPATQIADIVVRFAGGFVESSLSADDVLSRRRLGVYDRNPGLPRSSGLFSQVLVNRLNGRKLLRVGRQSTTIGAASLPLFAEVLRDLLNQLVGLSLTPGKIFIHGSSSGGRNAIDFAAHLSRLGFKPHFVAAIDAAFFQADTTSRPQSTTGLGITVPDFVVNAGSTPRANLHNFFQTLGNHAKNTLTQGVLFTSSMKGEEIHGNLVGFQNHDLSPRLPRPKNDDDAHVECGTLGSSEAQQKIADDLQRPS